MDPMDQLDAQEEMYARIAKSAGDSRNQKVGPLDKSLLRDKKSKPLVLTNRILKPIERRAIAKLKARAIELKSAINMENEYRQLNPEDHPVTSSPTQKKINQSIKNEEGLRMQLKTTKSMISNVKAGAFTNKSRSLIVAEKGLGGARGGMMVAINRWKDLFS